MYYNHRSSRFQTYIAITETVIVALPSGSGTLNTTSDVAVSPVSDVAVINRALSPGLNRVKSKTNGKSPMYGTLPKKFMILYYG